MPLRVYQKYLFILLSMAYMLPFIQPVVMTVVAKDLMREMALSPEKAGFLGSTYLYGYAACMLFSGVLAARFGPRRFLACMFFVAGMGGVVFACAHSFAVACVGRALCGAGTSVVLTSALTLFARWFRGESYSRLCSLFFSVGGTGALLGSAPLSYVTSAWGWRTAFLIVAGLTLFYAVLVYLTVRDWPPAEAEEELGLVAAPRDPVRLGTMWSAVRYLARNADFWKLACWFIGMSGIYLSFVGLWAIPYLKDVFAYTPVKAGGVVGLFSVGFIVGNPLLSWLCDKKLHSNRAALGVAGALGLAAFAPLLVFGRGLHDYWVMAIALALGMALNSPNAIVYASARNVFGSRLSGMASGFLACCCFISGAVLQVVCGAILTFAGNRGFGAEGAYALAFSPYVLCFILAAVSGFTLSRASDPGHVSPESLRFAVERRRAGAEGG